MHSTKIGELSSKEVGRLGEDIAARFLMKQGQQVIAKNYAEKWGEIDLVTRETVASGDKVHFVEVKTVSHETEADLRQAVSHETWRPEEQVTAFKLHQIHKTLHTWLSEHHYEGDWMIDVVAIRVVPRERLAVVEYIESV